MLLVARGLKAHGIRGDIKAECLADSPDALTKLPALTAQGQEYKTEYVRAFGAYVLIKLAGINTAEGAENFRNAEFFAHRADMPKLDDDTFYIEDVIGCSVFADGRNIGAVTDILNHGSADIYVVKGTKNVMFPYVSGLITKFDLENKSIYLDGKLFGEVAVYED